MEAVAPVRSEADINTHTYGLTTVDMQNAFYTVLQDMKTNAEGIAYWKEYVFMTSAGACSATDVPNGSIR